MRIEHWLYEIPLRLRSLFRRGRVEQDLDDELQYHLEQKTAEHIREGMSPERARQAALRAMDGFTQHKEECRDARGVNFIDNLAQDVRYGLRVLAKSPGFTAVAVVTLALAIGANAVVFGVFDAAILRPLNVPDAQSLYVIQRGEKRILQQSYPDYLDLRDRNRSFDGLAAFTITLTGMDTGNHATRAWVYEVSGNYFEILRIQPHLGRFFHSSDERGVNSAPYIVLSHAYWRSRFHEDSGVIGRAVLINKNPFTIVGVAPPGFRGTMAFLSPDFFVPMVNREQVDGANTMGTGLLASRASRSVNMVIGHLKPGVTPSQAIADLDAVGAWLEQTYPKEDSDMQFTLARPGLFGDTIGRPVKAFLSGLMALAGLILLAACANLGNIFAARAADRAREVALRMAIGASRTRILRQLLTEAILISLAGGAAGLWGSVVLLRQLAAWQPVPRFPVNLPLEPDAKVYLIALVLAIASGLLFGLAPLRQVHRTDPYLTIKSGSIGGVRRRLGFRDVLLAGQIAICAVLVTSSMVALRGLNRSLHSDFGFQPRHTTVMNFDLYMAGYRGDAVGATQRRILDGMAEIPGVESAGLIDRLPLSGNAVTTNVFADDATDTRPANVLANPVIYSVSPEYFRTAATRLVAGRHLTPHDGPNAPRVAVVNREFARRVFGSADAALGRHIKRRAGTRIQIVGVVEDGKYQSLTEDPVPVMFSPMLQVPVSDAWLIVRSSRDQQQLAAAMRHTLRGIDAGLPFHMGTWSGELDLMLFPSRVAAASLGVLGAMGALLSITGIFGMAAYSVSKRLKELGIRLALGAQRKEVLHAALGRAFRLLAFGSAAGMILGVLATRLLGAIVYQATPRDPLVLGAAIVAMLLVGVVATWIPANRALSLDPVKLLREE